MNIFTGNLLGWYSRERFAVEIIAPLWKGSTDFLRLPPNVRKISACKAETSFFSPPWLISATSKGEIVPKFLPSSDPLQNSGLRVPVKARPKWCWGSKLEGRNFNKICAPHLLFFCSSSDCSWENNFCNLTKQDQMISSQRILFALPHLRSSTTSVRQTHENCQIV